MEPVVPARSPLSSIVRRLDHIVAHSAFTAVVGVLVGGFVVVLALAGFPESWQFAFSTLASAVTLVMVFVLHHAQHREQAATQLKLDELVRAIPQADDRYVHVQAAEDDELREMEQRHIEHHQATRSGSET
jgi:low affinity Fe/Cu permease